MVIWAREMGWDVISVAVGMLSAAQLGQEAGETNHILVNRSLWDFLTWLGLSLHVNVCQPFSRLMS